MAFSLEVVPFDKRPGDNDSFCRWKNDQLIVRIKNLGPHLATPTRVRVDFRNYGSCTNPKDRKPQEKNTPPIPKNKFEDVPFDCPDRNCFDPLCAFDITIDPAGGDPEKYYRGVCKKGPDLVAIPDKDYLTSGYYWKRNGNKMNVIVQNQGTARAVPSRIRVDFKNIPPPTHVFENTIALDPHDEDTVKVDIPVPLRTIDFEATVTVDVDNKVDESNETNNIVSGWCKK